MMYAVILAGGGGTRLWPLSTPARPKPFLPLLGDRSLLQLTGDRLAGVIEPEDVFVVTDRRYARFVRRQVPRATTLEEPEGRNTAAAVALATLAIDRAEDETMAVLPADQVIEKADVYRDVLAAVDRGLARGPFGIADPLVTLGIQPQGPATAYGYLRPRLAAGEVLEGLQAYPLEAFEEKPKPERAQELMRMRGVCWNAGMFLWRRQVIRGALRRFAPDIGAVIEAETHGDLDAAYARVRTTSIDYAVLEPAAAAGQVVMAGMDVGWSDLGSWTVLLERLGVGPGVSGRVVPAGEAVHLGEGDLLVRREGWPLGGPFDIAVGPGTMDAFATPAALLTGAQPDREIVEALLARVAAQEA